MTGDQLKPNRVAATVPSGAFQPGDPGGGAGTFASLRDIKDLVPVSTAPHGTPFWIWAMPVVLFLVVVGRMWRRRRFSRPRPAADGPERSPDDPAPLEAALAELDALTENPAADARDFYFRLATVLRTQLGRQHSIGALAMTEPELLAALPSLALAPEREQALRDFLARSEVIKFAGRRESREVMRRDLAWVRRWVAETLESKPADVSLR